MRMKRVRGSAEADTAGAVGGGAEAATAAGAEAEVGDEGEVASGRSVAAGKCVVLYPVVAVEEDEEADTSGAPAVGTPFPNKL